MVNFFWVQWDLHSVPDKARDQIELWGLRKFFEKKLSIKWSNDTKRRYKCIEYCDTHSL